MNALIGCPGSGFTPSGMTAERGWCRGCHGHYSITRGGLIRAHRIDVHTAFMATQRMLKEAGFR